MRLYAETSGLRVRQVLGVPPASGGGTGRTATAPDLDRGAAGRFAIRMATGSASTLDRVWGRLGAPLAVTAAAALLLLGVLALLRLRPPDRR